MKSIKVIVIGFILAIALVAWPAGYMQYITAGIGFLLAAVLMAWLGVRRRKSAQKEYEDEMRRYTAHTMMKIVRIEESVEERWEHQEDGSDQLRRETVYLPTYEYAVNGRTYRTQAVRVFPASGISGGRLLAITILISPTTLRKTAPENLSWADSCSSSEL